MQQRIIRTQRVFRFLVCDAVPVNRPNNLIVAKLKFGESSDTPMARIGFAALCPTRVQGNMSRFAFRGYHLPSYT